MAVDRRATPPLGATVMLFRERLANGPTVAVGFGPQYDVATDGGFLLNLAVAPPETPATSIRRPAGRS